MPENFITEHDVHSQSLYWSTYTEDQQRALLSLPCNDLSGEINLLRILLLRFLNQEVKTPPADTHRSLAGLQAKCRAVMAIACLKTIQMKEAIAHPWWKPVLDEAYHQARLEMGIYDYLDRCEQPS